MCSVLARTWTAAPQTCPCCRWLASRQQGGCPLLHLLVLLPQRRHWPVKRGPAATRLPRRRSPGGSALGSRLHHRQPPHCSRCRPLQLPAPSPPLHHVGVGRQSAQHQLLREQVKRPDCCWCSRVPPCRLQQRLLPLRLQMRHHLHCHQTGAALLWQGAVVPYPPPLQAPCWARRTCPTVPHSRRPNCWLPLQAQVPQHHAAAAAAARTAVRLLRQRQQLAAASSACHPGCPGHQCLPQAGCCYSCAPLVLLVLLAVLLRPRCRQLPAAALELLLRNQTASQMSQTGRHGHCRQSLPCHLLLRRHCRARAPHQCCFACLLVSVRRLPWLHAPPAARWVAGVAVLQWQPVQPAALPQLPRACRYCAGAAARCKWAWAAAGGVDSLPASPGQRCRCLPPHPAHLPQARLSVAQPLPPPARAALQGQMAQHLLQGCPAALPWALHAVARSHSPLRWCRRLRRQRTAPARGLAAAAAPPAAAGPLGRWRLPCQRLSAS